MNGCQRKASGYSRLCNSHKTHDRRHGHPLQKGITKSDLRSYRTQVDTWIKQHPRDDIWSRLRAQLSNLREEAEAHVRSYERGKPAYGHRVFAYRSIVEICEEATEKEIIETALAMVLLREFDPFAFKSDQAFWVQMARRVRGLSSTAYGSYWDPDTQRTKTYYRYPSNKAQVALGRIVVEAFGLSGITIAKDIKNRKKSGKEIRRAVMEATTEGRGE